jgi:hypothetical protein
VSAGEEVQEFRVQERGEWHALHGRVELQDEVRDVEPVFGGRVGDVLI